jgi:probable phosphoglycerate mutase
MEVETTIFTMRHGRTKYNAEKRYAGSIDVSLNESGILDAREACQKLARFRFNVVIASTLQRSIETARIIAGDSVQIVQNRLCNERNFGILEGRTWDEVQNLEPPVLFIKVGDDLHSVNPKGGEPFEDVWERAKKFRRFLFKKYQGSNVLIVSHGVFLQLFHGVLRGLSCIESLAFAYPANLELSIFRFCDKHLVDEKAVRLGGSNGLTF